MTKKGKRAKKPSPDKSTAAQKSGSRTRKLTRFQRRKQDKKQSRESSKMPGSFRLVAQVWNIFQKYWKPLGGIVLVYLILNIIFASGLSSLSSSVSDIKANLEADSDRSLTNALGGFGSLVGSAGANSSQTASILQTILIIIESLVIIWALRQLLAGSKIGVKQAYYRSTGQLVPFLLVLIVIFIQLLPVTLGTAIVSTVLSAIFNSSTLLTTIMIICFMALAAWSVYMVSSSAFALYIVTLPDMQPRQALKSAKNLVRFRRWPIVRKVLFLPIFILLAMALAVIPLILWANWFVAPVFYVLSMVAILFVHSYLYSLYRSLLE